MPKKSNVNDKTLNEYIKSQKELKDKLKELNLNKTIRNEQINEDFQPIISPLKQSVINSNNLSEGLNSLQEDLNITIPASNNYLKSINNYQKVHGDQYLKKLNELNNETQLLRSEIKKLSPIKSNAQKLEKIHSDFIKILPLSNKSVSLPKLDDFFKEVNSQSPNTSKNINDDVFTTPSSSTSSVNETLSTPVNFVQNRVGNMAMKYLNMNSSDAKLCDNIFGLRSENGKDLWIGDSEVKIEGNDIIFKDTKYTGTKGLWELMTLKDPSLFTDHDMEMYESIILKSYAYMQNNDKNTKRIKSSAGNKYINFIRPMLLKNKILKEKSGGGLSNNFKVYNKSNTEYVYWNDINELKDRLLLLLGEYEAGNDSPQIHNEIMNIIEELREENII